MCPQGPKFPSSPFANVKVESQRRIFDGSASSQAIFRRLLDDCKRNLPADCVLLGRNMPITYVYVAGDAFSLRRNIMKDKAGAEKQDR